MERSERDWEPRVARLEEDMGEVRAALARLEPTIVRIDATLPHLATKAELAATKAELAEKLAEKPGKLYLWGMLTALIAAYGAGLAAVAVLH